MGLTLMMMGGARSSRTAILNLLTQEKPFLESFCEGAPLASSFVYLLNSFIFREHAPIRVELTALQRVGPGQFFSFYVLLLYKFTAMGSDKDPSL